jgi:hypothetical protein
MYSAMACIPTPIKKTDKEKEEEGKGQGQGKGKEGRPHRLSSSQSLVSGQMLL